MSWAVVAGAAISTIGGAVTANQNRPARTVMPEPTDPNVIARQTIEGNRANLPAATRLAGDINRDAQDLASSNIERAVPGFTALRDMMLKMAQSNMDDPYGVPQDVEDNIGRLAAERGTSVGGRGQFADFSALRDFGLNSLAYGNSRINQAQSLFSMATQLSPVVNPVSPIAFLTDTNTAIQTDQTNKGLTQGAGQGAANAEQAARAARNQGYGQALGAFAGLVQNLPVWSTNGGTSGGAEMAGGYGGAAYGNSSSNSPYAKL